MEHDFDPVSQYCRACHIPRVVADDLAKFRKCTGSIYMRDMYMLTADQLRRMKTEAVVPLPERGFGT